MRIVLEELPPLPVPGRALDVHGRHDARAGVAVPDLRMQLLGQLPTAHRGCCNLSQLPPATKTGEAEHSRVCSTRPA